MERDPCPFRIVMDCGGAYTIGFVGGSLWHGIKGLRMNPKGMKTHGALAAIRAKAPITGGSFAVWGGLFSTFDCTLAYIRKTEDPLNPIMSGAITGGVLAARGGWAAAGKSAAIGGVLLALIEGVNFMLMRSLPGADPSMMRPEDQLAPVDMIAPYVSQEDLISNTGLAGAGPAEHEYGANGAQVDYDQYNTGNIDTYGQQQQEQSSGFGLGSLPEWAREIEEEAPKNEGGFLGENDWKKDKWDKW
mmetsp:Transcript_233/g.804  ORF Transcript_233/g.804 Transcript_233/m.804 type:complete len:246 (+) Transcript_233:192-929(+)|eukprot:CAMPEP_0114627880 /NCGR_PEP_ID=MMETSP0168-20121206/12529_1 /TAXON_ID=95228 ORGANISM="Vannella sp., Strain DIVA3 517/6/12" /NCGR_SAMPLE_ID=MMETSP0168 /ASSEMBLY_ACC=CAM_ASM_000044 /LENGTH=245 /DNA_ID=CAMNT_0001839237 /DNA_START=131 /DNA_END=868 /DNA_ORIENTATION=-